MSHVKSRTSAINMKMTTNSQKLLYVFIALLFPLASLAVDPSDVARDRLVSEVKVWVASQLGVEAERVEIPPLDGRMRVPVCPSGTRFDFPCPSRDLVRVSCVSPAWQLFIQANMRAERKIYVAARDLASGQVLGEADLAVRISKDSAQAGEIEERSTVVGRILKRPLAAGAAMLARDLDEAVKVVRIAVPIKAGSMLAQDAYKLEVLPRALVPAGAAPGVQLVEGTRAARDLAAGHIVLSGELSEFRNVLVARRNLMEGHAVEASMFEMGMVNARDGVRYYTSIGSVELAELTRNLQAGEPLRLSDVRPAILVRRGQVVTLTLGTNIGVEVTLRAEAMQDGRLGETVQLRNPESGREMSGVVTGKNAARGL